MVKGRAGLTFLSVHPPTHAPQSSPTQMALYLLISTFNHTSSLAS